VQLARVIGDVVVTVKDPNLTGITLLVLQPLDPHGAAAGRTLVALDAVGAGVGETVFFVRGKEASVPFHPTQVPADAGIVGIVDHWTVEPPNPERRTKGESRASRAERPEPRAQSREPKA
jgi:microcompartment protein CcmK/EutM